MTSYTIAFLSDTKDSVKYALKLKETNHSLKVYSGNEKVAEAFAEAGLDPVSERAQALEGAQVVVTYFEESLRSESAYLACKGGLLTSCPAGTLFVNLSQTTPAISRDIAAAAGLNDSVAIDAVVDNAGSIFVGAEKTDSEILTDLVDAMGEKVFWFEHAGAGCVAYLAQQISVAATLMGMCDAMALCQVEDVNLDRIVEMFKGGMAQSYVADRFAQKAADGEYTETLSAQELRRDVAVSLMRADERELALPASQTAFTLLDTLCEMGGKNLGIQTMSVLYQDEAQAAAAGLDWSNVSDAEGLESYFADDEDGASCGCGDDHCGCGDDHCGCDH